MNVEIAERLAAKRKERGYSQEELAAELGVSRQAVSKWERSESSPDTDNLIALAKLYGVGLDDLLYVDESIADDVSFEAKDKAATASTPQSDASSSATDGPADESQTEGSEDEGFNTTGKKGEKVHVGVDGVHVEDGKDSVHVGWNGIHVQDGKKGEEVHVGWNGIHVKSAGGSSSDGKPHQVDVDGSGAVVDGVEYHDWRDVRSFHNDTSSSGALKSLNRFPWWAVAILAYVAIGLTTNAWGVGLFVFFTIPAYYILVNGICRHEFAKAIGGLYPIVVTAWFLYMAFVLNQPHPAWVIFFTIPLVEWAIMAPSRWWNRRRREKKAEQQEQQRREAETIEVENEADKIK